MMHYSFCEGCKHEAHLRHCLYEGCLCGSLANRTLRPDPLDTANEQISALQQQLTRWKKAIEGLTPSGSEFVNDPEACAAYIRDRYNPLHTFKELREQVERLTEYNNNGHAGYMKLAALGLDKPKVQGLETCLKCGHWHGGVGNEPGNPCTHYVESLKAECGCTDARKAVAYLPDQLPEMVTALNNSLDISRSQTKDAFERIANTHNECLVIKRENKDLRGMLSSVWDMMEGDIEGIAPVLHGKIQAALAPLAAREALDAAGKQVPSPCAAQSEEGK